MQFFRGFDKPYFLAGTQIDNFRNQQYLRRNFIFRQQRSLQVFHDNPLVRRMLVNNDNAVLGLRNDIGVMKLSFCQSQRTYFAAVIRSGNRRIRLVYLNRKNFSLQFRQFSLTARLGHKRPKCGNIAAAGLMFLQNRNFIFTKTGNVVMHKSGQIQIIRRTMVAKRQRLTNGADQQPANQRVVIKPHFCFGRMHVYVYIRRINVKIKRRHRITVVCQNVLIVPFYRAQQQFVAHRTVIDKQILIQRV